MVLTAGMSAVAAEDDMDAFYGRDRLLLKRELGSDEPAKWIHSTVGSYLAEAAHELRAVAALLRGRIVTASIGPLARAIVERIGVTSWVLEVEEAAGPGMPVPDAIWAAVVDQSCPRQRRRHD